MVALRIYAVEHIKSRFLRVISTEGHAAKAWQQIRELILESCLHDTTSC